MQQNSLPSSGKKLANRKEVSIPTICFCTTSGAAYLCVFHLWLISNWPTYSNILLQYVVFLEAFHCCRVGWVFLGFFSPACWYMDVLCVVSLTVFSLLTPTLSSRPESPVLWVYFFYIFVYIFSPVLFSPFPHQFAYYPLVNLFNVSWIFCGFLCFSLS